MNWFDFATTIVTLIAGFSLGWTTSAVRERNRVKRAPTSIDVPGGIVTFPGTITDADMAEFKRRWREAYAGGRGRMTVMGNEPTITEEDQ